MKSVFFNDIADHGARSRSRFLNSLAREISYPTRIYLLVLPAHLYPSWLAEKCEIASSLTQRY